jgi:hypothetical protein
MTVTLSGIGALVRLVQPENAHCPMLVTPSEITTLFRVAAFWKAQALMLETPAGTE